MPENAKKTKVDRETVQPELATAESAETRKTSVEETVAPEQATGPEETGNDGSGEGEDLAAVVQRLKEENETLHNNYLRLRADLENIRRRTQNEIASIRQTASEALINRLLPVLDNLERAVSANAENEAWKKGVEMVLCQFQEVLAAEGLQPIPAVGEIFNPELHEAVFAEPADAPEGTILQELQKGYILNGKVIRFSKVKVVS
ncbi:MAG TPA: nucleotide exchange factor GrpE [Firmicutes bacterium]|nr:nucleotide exchange factor GrpE [Bacillota bacterium]HOQ24161.1 nucleotide exchange factor GrpE [Bacillota bacterium]HPT67572.1 nucleotide exchange factor GrpE [Bacillota bacterium]